MPDTFATTVREAMHAGCTCIGEGETVLEAARMMEQLDVGALPICGEDDRLHGIITDRDIVVKVLGRNRDPRTTFAGRARAGPAHPHHAPTRRSRRRCA